MLTLSASVDYVRDNEVYLTADAQLIVTLR